MKKNKFFLEEEVTKQHQENVSQAVESYLKRNSENYQETRKKERRLTILGLLGLGFSAAASFFIFVKVKQEDSTQQANLPKKTPPNLTSSEDELELIAENEVLEVMDLLEDLDDLEDWETV